MARTEYVASFRAAVTAPRFNFQLRDLAAEGTRLGLLSPEERVAMETRSVLPDWLEGELGTPEDVPESTTYQRRLVHTGRRHEHEPARVFGDGWLPAPFDVLDTRSPDVYVTSGGPARVLAANHLDAVQLQDGFVPELTRRDNLWGWQVSQHRDFHHLPGHALMLVVEGSSLFSHWLLDTVPRFHVLEQAGISLDEFDHVLVAMKARPFHRETIERLGLADGRVVGRQALGPLVSCDAFTHVSEVRQGFVADPFVYDYVAQLYGVKPAAQPARRLWISRAGAGRRRMPNEAELLRVLEEFGFESVRTEDLGVAGAAQLCAEAEVIAGPHGAGLANVAFMPPGGQVLEIYGAHLSTEYWRICADRGIGYTCLQGTDADGRPLDRETVERMSYFDRNHADVHVTPERLRAALTELLGEPDRRKTMTSSTQASDRIALDEVFARPRSREVSVEARLPVTQLLEQLFDRLVDAAEPTKVAEVGAFEADFSRRARARFPEAGVFAFEANPRVAEHYTDEARAAGVDYRHLAIGAEAGTATIHVPEMIRNNEMPFINRMGSLHGLAVKNSKTVPLEVPMDTLDHAIAADAHDRIALWVDVEGAVDQVLAGADATLAATQVLVCELETTALWEGQPLADEIRARLAQAGLQLVARDAQKTFQYNAVFVRPELLERPGVAGLVEEYVGAATDLWEQLLAALPAPTPPSEPAPTGRRARWLRRLRRS